MNQSWTAVIGACYPGWVPEHSGARRIRLGSLPWQLFPAEANPTAEGLCLRLWELLSHCTGLDVAVRRIGGAEGLAHVHIADSVPAGGIMRGRFRSSGPIWRCRW